MRVLVTGADGFVGGHLAAALLAAGATPIGAAGPDAAEHALDVRDAAAVERVVAEAEPDAVVHLAALSSVAESHRSARATFEVNCLGTLNLLESLRRVAPRARLLFVSSGEIYGQLAPGERAREDRVARPASPYAASKIAAEVLALQFARSYGLDALCVRPFSHLGRGQAAHFAVPSFAAQIAAIQRGAAPAVLRTGDLSAIRDFSHVGDVVRAYVHLLGAGERGAVYNVASGVGRTIQSLLEEMFELAGLEARTEIDPERLRPIEISSLIGDASRLEALGWRRTLDVRAALVGALEEHGVAVGPRAG